MSVPPFPPVPGSAARPEIVWGPPPGAWLPLGPPSSGFPPASGAPARRSAADRPLVVVLVALAAFLVGAVAAGVFAMLLFFAGAEEMGRGIGEEFAASTEEPMEGFDYGPVDEYPAVAPEFLGTDPELDRYATACFEGDLRACDDLYFEAPPMSDYEDYAITCGGRVKSWSLVSCTELE